MAAGFPIELIKLVLCPKDSGALVVAQATQLNYVDAGVARCMKCGASYEIRHGILRILPGQEPLDPISVNEQGARDLKAEAYDAHFSEWTNFVELSALLKEKSSFVGKVVLDFACGTGRITTHVLPHARAVLASDISETSLRVFAEKVGVGANLGLVWGDATQLRIAPASIDFALSTQLLEHIPTTAKRAKFLQGVHSALTRAGVLLLTVYYYSTLRRLLHKGQEGHHSNGIFYRRFTCDEIKNELSGLFRIGVLQPIQIDPRALSLWPPIGNWLGQRLETTFMRDLIGQLLFVEATKEPGTYR